MALVVSLEFGSLAATQNDSGAAIQNDSPTETSLGNEQVDLRLGPFDLHPSLSAGLTYDDNILLSSGSHEADAIWTVQPGLQAVAGDDAALISYRDQYRDVLSLSPGNLIIQQPEDRPGKLFILDYSPAFQVFDKYTANNFVDQFATLNVLWPVDKLILGIRQDYTLQKTEIIEFDQRTTVQTIPTTLSAAYQFDDKSSIESDFRRYGIDYYQTGLTGYMEYNNEDWYNYRLKEKLTMSLGILGGEDVVANHQDQTFEQLRTRARYVYTEKLTFDVSVGAELRQYENSLPDTVFPVFTLSADYRLAERTSLRLTGLRQQYAAIYNGYNYSTTGATLELRQGIKDRFTATLSAGYYNVDFTPITTTLKEYTSDYYVVRIGLEAKIIRHLTGQIFYQRLNNQSLVNGNVGDNQAGVQANWSF